MIIIDTDVAIGILHGKINIEQFSNLLSSSDQLAISSLSIYEIYFGYNMWKYSKKAKKSSKSLDKELRSINKLISQLIEIQFDGRAAFKSSEIYHKLSGKGQKIEIFDCMIAGSMIINGVRKIITNNVKHYSKILELEIIPLSNGQR